MKKRTLLSIVLCFSIIFSIAFIKDAPKAKAIYPISMSIANFIPETLSSIGVTGQWVQDIAVYVAEHLDSVIITASKMAALIAVQKITQAIMGTGGGGAISDYNNYLYIAPQQRAMAQMNSFFNTVSRGRLSSLNYEGVGPNYDAYLVAQARQSIAGQPFTTNLQDYATDPTQLFAGGNMKGIMTYMQCANNVACYTLTSTAQYNLEYAKAQTIAKSEQDRGFLPVKKNGKIIQPSVIVSSALTQMDQLGTQVIMNADASKNADLASSLTQIAAGATINIAARSFNYMLADSTGKDAIQNKNDDFPFSLGYSTNGGIGLNAGGASINTGVAALSLQTMIGNTCATMSGALSGNGAVVTVQGKKYNCITKQEASGAAPTVTLSLPTYNCTTGTTTCSYFGNYTCSPTTSRCVSN
ncbi:MAG: hypothetical protein HGA36_00810 [Candidatus Moranbacteria bacterium]|nr:hypothetical protein [Candidatus Moranbacteria bacterium]